MTFLANETSAEDGAPVELYELSVGFDTFNLTSAEDEFVDGVTTYTPTEVKRTTITVGPEDRQDVLELSLPSDHEFVQRFISIPPGQEATLTIKRFHRFDGATPEILVWFKGIVRSVGFSDDGFRSTIAVTPLTGGLSRLVPRFLYSNVCNHVHYDSGCKVIQNNFRLQGTITVVDGFDITVPGASGFADDFFNSGFVSLGGSDFRLVLDHTGDVLRLLLPFPNADLIGSAVDVFAGCDHSIVVCKTKYNNVLNYGGFAFVPTKNPFETGIL